MSSQETLEDLCCAIELKKIEKVKEILLKNPEIIQIRPGDSTQRDEVIQIPKISPLWNAIFNESVEIVKLLIDFGAHVDERYFSIRKDKLVGKTFLHWFASQDDLREHDKEIAEVLIRHGANIEAHLEDYVQETPLEIAIDNGNVQCTEFLLDKGAKFNYWLFEDVLLCTTKIKQKQMLELLIKRGLVTSEFRNEIGTNYLHLAISNAIYRTKYDVDIVETAKTLINLGAWSISNDYMIMKDDHRCFSLYLYKTLNYCQFLLKMELM